jgi:hypothetical protein
LVLSVLSAAIKSILRTSRKICEGTTWPSHVSTNC